MDNNDKSGVQKPRLDQFWLLRVPPDPTTRTLRTSELLQELAAKNLDATVEAKPTRGGEFEPLGKYEQFQAYFSDLLPVPLTQRDPPHSSDKSVEALVKRKKTQTAKRPAVALGTRTHIQPMSTEWRITIGVCVTFGVLVLTGLSQGWFFAARRPVTLENSITPLASVTQPASVIEKPLPLPPHKSFVEEQVGAVWREAPNANGERPLSKWLEEICKWHGTGERPGKWIDDLPATKPLATNPQDILPILNMKELFHNKQAVEDHNPVFEQRNPKTAAGLAAFSVRPQVPNVPGENFKAYREHYGIHLVRQTEKTKFFQMIADGLLYTDFLICRGGEPGKVNALTLSRSVFFSLDCNILKHTDDNSLFGHVAQEMILPLLDPDTGCFDMEFIPSITSAFKRCGMTKERLQFHKWILSNDVPCNEAFKNLMLIQRSNDYGRLKDFAGIILSAHSVRPDGRDASTLLWIKRCLVRMYGDEEGTEKFREYLSLLDEAAGHPVVKAMRDEEAKLATVSKAATANEPSKPAAAKPLPTVGF